MTTHEAIEIIQVAKAQIEWDLPLDYAAAFDKAVYAIDHVEKLKEENTKLKRKITPLLPDYQYKDISWGASGYYAPFCPSCKEMLLDTERIVVKNDKRVYRTTYCSGCGQAIRWE